LSARGRANSLAQFFYVFGSMGLSKTVSGNAFWSELLQLWFSQEADQILQRIITPLMMGLKRDITVQIPPVLGL